MILNILFKIASIVGLVLFIFSVLVMLLTFRKTKKISPLSFIVSMFISLTVLIIYTELLRVKIPSLFWLVSLFAGGLIGVGWSLMSRLILERGLIKSQGNIWYLIIWGIVFIMNQLIVIFTGRPAEIAMVMLLVSTGLVIGNSGSILVRFYKMKTTLKEI